MVDFTRIKAVRHVIAETLWLKKLRVVEAGGTRTSGERTQVGQQRQPCLRTASVVYVHRNMYATLTYAENSTAPVFRL